MSSYQLLLNQVLLEDQNMSSHLPFHAQTSSYLPNYAFLPFGYHHQLVKTTMAPDHTSNSHDQLSESLSSPDLNHKNFEGPSVARSNTCNTPWPWGQVDGGLGSKRSYDGGGDQNYQLGVGAMKMKKMKARRKVREPRFCFKTMSDVDVLDDGYKWRKYGQKVVKNTQHPRSYYRCTQDNCRVKKRVERLAEDPRMVITTYEGRHAHSPSQDLENPQVNNFFW